MCVPVCAVCVQIPMEAGRVLDPPERVLKINRGSSRNRHLTSQPVLQPHLPKDSAAHSGLGPPLSAISQDAFLQTWQQTIWLHKICDNGFLFPCYSRLSM